jgi:hypothetical protein
MKEFHLTRLLNKRFEQNSPCPQTVRETKIYSNENGKISCFVYAFEHFVSMEEVLRTRRGTFKQPHYAYLEEELLEIFS